MCGIAGIWNLDGTRLSEQVLSAFTDSLAHRGPDGNGFHVDAKANLGLGQRRLAILDTTDTGRQPMSYADGRYWITYNGEIYNFLELRHELAHAGCSFRSESDTEVIMAAYDRWGPDCQLRFNGMWALAIWDSVERVLFLSRDRFGVKPLHFLYDGRRFAFASEMKAFLALEEFRLEFDPAVVAAALSDPESVEGSERCLLQGLRRLPGGHSLTLHSDRAPEIRRWWNTLDHLQEVPADFAAQAERYRELFLDACRIRMRSDVPIGTALSGGLDSSSIACGMHHLRSGGGGGERLAADWQRAFVATYPGSVIDERAYADAVIGKTGAVPVYCEITPQMYVDHFEQVLFQYEEISDLHLGPWIVHREQRRNGVIVTLDGHGGDEALGGYPWHITAALGDSLRTLRPRTAASLLGTMKGLELFPARQFYWRSAQELARKLWLKRFPPARARWLRQAPAPFVSAPLEQDLPRLRGRDALFRRLYIDFHFTQLPMNLRDFDRLSMAHGVEVRSPFMDWRLVAFAFSLPASSKIGGGYTKRILRSALHGILPAAIEHRQRKLGFPNLPEAWSTRRAQDMLRDSVASRDFRESGIWDGLAVQARVNMGIDPRSAEARQAWGFVQAMQLMKSFREHQRVST
jgi:asparagine synthase (glutamine-hydrolysing)